MPQLHLYVSDEVAIQLRARARERGTSVSRLLAEIFTRDTRRAWPEAWLDRVAGRGPVPGRPERAAALVDAFCEPFASLPFDDPASRRTPGSVRTSGRTARRSVSARSRRSPSPTASPW